MPRRLKSARRIASMNVNRTASMATKTYTANTRIKMGGERFMPGATLELTEDQAKTLGTAVTLGARTTKAAAGRRGAAAPTTPPAGDETDPLEGVEFASPQAKLKARDAGLVAEDFKHQRKESEGGFTVGDVERLEEKKTAPGE